MRGWSLVNRYFLCQEKEESIDHLLIHCVNTRVIWHLLFSLFGVEWLLLYSIKNTLLGWHSSFVGKKWKKRVASYSLMFTMNNLERKK